MKKSLLHLTRILPVLFLLFVGKIFAQNSATSFESDTAACPPDLLLLLRLDELTGPEYHDFYGLHTATAFDAPISVTGRIRRAQLFDAGTKVDIPDLADEFDWPTGASFSIEFWLKTNNTATMVCLGRHRLDTDSTAFWYVGTDQVSGQFAEFEVRDNGGKLSHITGKTIVNDNVWHHIVAVRDGVADFNRLYVDGKEDAHLSIRYNSSFTTEIPTEINVGYLHRAQDGDNEYHLIGSLDEIAIYNRAISAAEDSAFYNTGNPKGHCLSGNYVPVINTEPVMNVNEDEPYQYIISVTDTNESDIINMTVAYKPAWMNFEYTAGAKTAILSGIPGNSDTGTDSVRVAITDGHTTINHSYLITVVAVNDAPVITSEPDPDAYVGNLYAYILTVTDEDDTLLIRSTVRKPDWLSFTDSLGILAGTPLQADKGQDTIILRVSDGKADTDQEFIINVDGPVVLDYLEAPGIRIFPIPAKNYLDIDFDSMTFPIKLEVINLSGYIIMEALIPSGTDKYRLNLKQIGPGTYFLHMQNNILNHIGKITVIK